MTKSRMSVDIDETMLKRLEFLDPKGEAGLMQSLVKLYIDSIPESMAKLRAVVATGSKPQLSKVAHALKSGHSNLGVKSIVAIFQKIEDQTFADDELPQLVNDVEEMSNEAGRALTTYLQKGK